MRERKGIVVHLRIVIILAVLILAGCQSQLAAVRPPLDEEGELFLYSQPFPREADRLGFSLEAVAAVRDDGAEFPLELSLHDLNGGEMHRQRFLASGRLAPGTYRGLALKTSRPSLKTETGTAALLAPNEPTILEVPFTVHRRQAQMLRLTLDYAKAVRQGFAFTPAFAVSQPGKPVTGLIGYVTDPATDTITVIDKQYREVVGVIATGRAPRGVVFDQQRKRAYVALSGEAAVAVLDLTTGEEMRRIRLLTGDAPEELALTPDGRTLLTVNAGSNTVSVVDPLSFFEAARIAVGDGPSSILIDPTGQRAYVFNSLATTISEIDIARRSVITTAASEPGLSRGSFNRAGDKLYTVHDLGSYLTALNPLTLAVQQRLYVGMGVASLKVDTMTDLVYAGRKSDPVVEVYEPFSLNSLATIRIGGSSAYMTIDGDENKLYVVNARRHKLQVVNLVSQQVEAELDTGREPCRVALMGER